MASMSRRRSGREAQQKQRNLGAPNPSASSAKDKGAARGAHRPRPQYGAQALHQPRRRILSAQAQSDGQRAGAQFGGSGVTQP